MHRNTYLLIVFLAIFATIVAIVNTTGIIRNRIAITPTPTPSLVPNVTPRTDVFLNEVCKISLLFPSTYELTKDASGNASLINPQTKDTIIMACQDEIPRPPLAKEFIENTNILSSNTLASISGQLFHDKSAEDGTPIDALIFHNPLLRKDIFIAGFGDIFNEIKKTIRITQ